MELSISFLRVISCSLVACIATQSWCCERHLTCADKSQALQPMPFPSALPFLFLYLVFYMLGCHSGALRDSCCSAYSSVAQFWPYGDRLGVVWVFHNYEPLEGSTVVKCPPRLPLLRSGFAFSLLLPYPCVVSGINPR